MIAAGWTNENDPAEEPARYVCKKVCPVRAICLGDAIHDPDSFGMRGGFFFIKGKVTYREGREIEKEFGMTPNTRQKPREFKETLPTDG